VRLSGQSPGTIRFPDDCTAKGYYLNAFADAFARYLPLENVTPSQPKGFRGAPPDFKTSQGNGCDVSELRETPSVSAACDGAMRDEEMLAEIEDFLEGFN
jgi:hypothetical protein